MRALRMRRAAPLPVHRGAGFGEPHAERIVNRTATYVYRKGRTVYALVAPEGSTYVMQSYALVVAPTIAEAGLAALGGRPRLPPGWSDHIHAWREDLVMQVLLEAAPGIRPHRPPKDSGSTMAGWYAPHGHYMPEEPGGLSVTAFAGAVRAEGFRCAPGANRPLHLHPLLQTADVYGHGRPTRIAHAPREVREAVGDLPATEAMCARVFTVPWFKWDRPEQIEEYAAAFRKVAEHAPQLLPADTGNPSDLGGWGLYRA